MQAIIHFEGFFHRLADFINPYKDAMSVFVVKKATQVEGSILVLDLFKFSIFVHDLNPFDMKEEELVKFKLRPHIFMIAC